MNRWEAIYLIALTVSIAVVLIVGMLTGAVQ